MSGTSLPEIPGWYINFQAAVLKQLPRPGQIDQAVAEGWDGNQGSLKKALAASLLPPTEATAKFALLADLGTIIVPEGYDHATRLASFGKENRRKFYFYKDAITDAKFPNPTRILKPGDKLRVRAFQQVAQGSTTSEERMAFLAEQKAVHTGAQGASLVFEQKRDELPKGYRYASFDKKDRLWKDADGGHRVPCIRAGSAGTFEFYLGLFEGAWCEGNAFLCFCDSE